MNRADRKALAECLRLHRKLGPKEAAEIKSMFARHGRQRAMFHACIRMQAINLGLGYFRLVPCELSPTSPPFVQGSPNDRGAEIVLVTKLDELGISRFTADPKRAIAAELKKREALAASTPDAA